MFHWFPRGSNGTCFRFAAGWPSVAASGSSGRCHGDGRARDFHLNFNDFGRFFFFRFYFFFPRRNKWRRSSIDARAKPQTNSDGSHLHNQISSCGQWENVLHKVHSDSHFGTFFFFFQFQFDLSTVYKIGHQMSRRHFVAFWCGDPIGYSASGHSKVWTNVIGTWPGKRHGPEVSAPVRERNIKTCGCAEKGHLFWPTEPE